MKTLKVYGASDDLIEFSGIEGADEFSVFNDHKSEKGIACPYMAAFAVDEKLKIHVIYDGRWSFAVSQYDEDIPLPDWPIRLSTYFMFAGRKLCPGDNPKRCYSTLLEIDVPDESKLKLIYPIDPIEEEG